MSAPRQVRFADSTGREWLVVEHPGIAGSAPAFGPSLLFVNHEIVRRVRDYPASWADLSPSELEALSWRT